MNSYDAGTLVVLSVTFASNGLPADPGGVTATVQKPDGSTVSAAYNPGAIVRDGVGAYHVNVDTTGGPSGTYSYKWSATGAVQADAHGGFFVYVPGF